ncbi:Auxin-induced protein 6B [Spatholobus suberectus]|nr:Auxin-induced protein 6B [Spatholobus suberectus]
MKLGNPSRIIRRLPSPLKLASRPSSWHTAKKPLLVAGESSDGRRSKVPKGFLAVYVGPELRRFVIPISFLEMPHFRDLMETVAEEYGCHHHGAIEIPCDEDYFEQILMSCSQRSKRIISPKKLNC